MNQFFSILINRHQDFFRLFMLLLSIILITSQFPKQGKFKYTFQVGKPWKYEDLIAPFPFAVKKSAEEIEEEKNERLKNFLPFFRYDYEAVQEKKTAFVSDFGKAYTELKQDSFQQSKKIDSLRHLRFGLSVLDKIYTKGIISVSDKYKNLSSTSFINVLNGNIADKKMIKNFYDLKEAYRQATSQVNGDKNIHGSFLMPLLEDAIAYNVFYDDSTTEKFQNSILENISYNRGLVQEGELVITTGTVVDKDKYQVILSLKDEYEERVAAEESGYIKLGYFILTSVVMILFMVFLAFFSEKAYNSGRELASLLLLIVLMIFIINWATKLNVPNLVVPFCIVPIVVRAFFGTRLAIYTHFTILILTGLIIPHGFEYLLLQFVAGTVAIFANTRTHYWSQFFISSGFILVTYWVGYLGISLIQEGNISKIQWQNYGWLTANVFLTLLAYPIIPIFEKVFGFVSEITLVELSDLNKPLLKELSMKAPGTFQHSLQVANLAEAAANEIGAYAMMVRVGSLYHDIGKMDNPLYFIENQSTEVNPHDDLPFEESAKIIIAHVHKGVEMAREHNLPDAIIDFIRTHHGTTQLQYFYHSFLKNFPEKEVDRRLFQYPGPLPFSKETAIVMMADSVEAASRSLKNPSPEQLYRLVDAIIDEKIMENQFKNSDITFKDINMVKKIFKKMLRSIHHVRVSYQV